MDQRQLKLRLGSAAAAGAVFNREDPSVGQQKYTSSVLDTHVLVSTYTTSCARSVKWLRNTMFMDLPPTNASYDRMDAQGAESPLGANGVLFHPYLNGDGEPYRIPTLRAKFSGLSDRTGRADLVRAVYEGVSMSIRDMLESRPGLWEMDEIVYLGGATKSALWMKILPDVLGKNGVVPKYGDASYGIALLAGTSVGLLDGAEAARRTKQTGVPVQYDPPHHELYNAIYARYKRHALLEHQADFPDSANK